MESPTIENLRQISADLGFKLDENELYSFHLCIERDIIPAFRELNEVEDPTPLAQAIVRERGRSPDLEENKFGAWAWKCSVRGKPGGILSGKRIALKDNIPLAGVPMTNGTAAMKDYVPKFDAEIVIRIIAAGGEIVGKATCENFCWTGGSCTSYPQPVLNPNNPNFMAGGSSSGSAALVAAGEVDIAVGADQGGSIRTPSSWCGVYGLKPTYGLVPYTGIITGEMTFDHAGPIGSTVEDTALLLEAIAGRDGVDPRQGFANTPMDTPRFFHDLKPTAEGLKIGIVSEGFGWKESETDVDKIVRESVEKFEELGAKLSEVSIPIHRKTLMLLFGVDSEGSWRSLRNKNLDFATFGYYNTDLARFLGERLEMNDENFSPNAKIVAIFGEYLIRKYHSVFYAKSQNIRPMVKKEYEKAFENLDLLVMPTTPMKAQPFPNKERDLADFVTAGWNMTSNVAPFDYTGNPAMNVPCGKSDGLPIGMMIVGSHFDEQIMLNAAFAFENLNENN